MKVLKFGGSSVATPDRVKSVIQIVKPYLGGEPVAIVFSAFGGVTDQLIRTARLAVAWDKSYQQQLAQIEERHLEAVKSLVAVQHQSSVLAHVKVTIHELEDVLQGIYLVGELTARTLDFVMSFGERLSAYIIAAAFRDAKIDAEYLDARTVVRSDKNFGYARIDFEKTNDQISRHFAQAKSLQVITGFIASTEEGETTTIGRSGSDYTAAIFARALNATSLEIWTDVDGMMTADPRKVKRAFTVPEMTYEEAMELSHFGAKVIFPATMKPAMETHIPIWIKNTFNPSFPGTCISTQSGNGMLIKGISSVNNISLLNIQGTGLLGVVGVSMRLFTALANEKVNVILISQASSEHSICLAVEGASAAAARRAIELEFQYEIRAGEMDHVHAEDNLAIVAVVGEHMKHNPGTSGRMFHALGKNGVNVSAIAQGSSELNISAVIRESDVAKALNALHEAFFLSKLKVLNVFLVGNGLIGKSLIQMMQEQYRTLAEQNQIEINLLGIANSRKMLFIPSGIEMGTASEQLLEKGVAMSMPAFVTTMMGLNMPNSIFVDCTASEEVTHHYETILSGNISIVTPNKKANAGSLSQYKALRKAASARGVRFLYETNVGAGLPVINTLNDLLLSGDKVIRIEAVLSGTMNFIFSSFDGSVPFSQVVRQAKEKGFTEPDPRDDLNGKDVARKILILSREAGLNLELNDIEVENMVPESCRAAGVDQFFDCLRNHDDHFHQLVKDAAEKGTKLRYTAVLENGKARVGLQAVSAQHPFYSLAGSDNIILLHTARYLDRPMVIRGPGAGAEVTAAGVFADIIRIGNYA
ncbi:MAG: bifunctional aspartate kinase/homoserine dehydrogenase I [Cyclobacteriaceae bacterium]